MMFFKIVRYSLLGAAAAVMIAGSFGLDGIYPDVAAAVIGGATAGLAAKFALLA